MHKFFWAGFGLVTHVVFGVTVAWLVPFLYGGAEGRGSLLVDALLAGQFTVGHSLLLWPPARDRLERFVPRALYGCFFCLATCLSLLVTFAAWQPNSRLMLWRLTGPAAWAMTAAFVLAWAALLYTLSLTGLGWQTGWTPFRAWLRGHKPPPRQFAPRGAYQFLRHPVYLSFLGLIWLTPSMSLDHAVLTAVWTAYIYVGSVLKDRRLEFYLGDTYRVYQTRVPGYPLLPAGPLARRRPELARAA
jgi:protein-S-isoprenylcysteine O-methyltransferase Ste14